jgi:hypothetical protein
LDADADEHQHLALKDQGSDEGTHQCSDENYACNAAVEMDHVLYLPLEADEEASAA